jgi:hypothetical protein
MKIVIQHNFSTGLGDLYCACTEYLNFIKPFKERGYETELIFSLNSHNFVNKYIGNCELSDLFDINSFNVFDKITSRQLAYSEKNYNGAKYVHTQYGPKDPGIHWWDVFVDGEYNINNYPNYCPLSYLKDRKRPSLLPIFNKEVYKRCDAFLNTLPSTHHTIQFRYYDYCKLLNEPLISALNIFKDKINNSTEHFHIGSNNEHFLNTLSSLQNVHTYKFNNLDLFSNDHSYFFYNKSINKDLLLDRIYDNLAEMVSYKYSATITHFSVLNWISNYLYYAFVNSENEVKFINIGSNLEELQKWNIQSHITT